MNTFMKVKRCQQLEVAKYTQPEFSDCTCQYQPESTLQTIQECCDNQSYTNDSTDFHADASYSARCSHQLESAKRMECNTSQTYPPSTSVKVPSIRPAKMARRTRVDSKNINAIAKPLSFRTSSSFRSNECCQSKDLKWECRNELNGHSDNVQCLLFHQGTLISASADNTIRIWSCTTWECTATLSGHEDIVEELVMYEGNLVSGSWDNKIMVWDLNTYKCINVLIGHNGGVSSLISCFDVVASGSWDSSIKIWNPISDVDCISTLNGHSQTVYALTNTDQYLISGSYDGYIKVWNPTTWSCHVTLNGHSSGIYSLAADSSTLFSGSSDCMIKVWDTSSWKCSQTLENEHSDTIHNLKLVQNRLFSASSDGRIIQWTYNDNLHQWKYDETVLENSENGYFAIGVSSVNESSKSTKDNNSEDSFQLAIGGDDCLITIWDSTTTLSIVKCTT